MSTSSVDIALVASAIVQAVATCILVLVTIYYAYQARATVRAMESGNKAEFLPIITATVHLRTSDTTTIHMTLENKGKGPAKRPVKIVFPGVAPLFINSLSPTDSQEIKLKYDIAYVLSIPENERKMCVSYEDIFGRTIRTEIFFREANNIGATRNAHGMRLEIWHCVIPG